MAFFRNDTVNLLNLHYGIHALAMSGGGAFFTAYLLRAGVPAPIVLASIALIVAGRFAIRPLMLVPARRFGLRPLVVVGTVLTGLQFPLLAEVHGVGWQLFAWCAFASIGDTLYWTSYHAYFASLGDAHHRGHQLGACEAIAAIVGIIGPLAGGWGLATLGPRVAFDVTAIVQILAAGPLFATPNVGVARAAPGVLAAAFPGVLMFAADGFMAAGFYFVWQIALFVELDESYTAYGGAVALAAMVGAAGGLALGRFIDEGHGRRAAWLATGAVVVAVALRALSLGHPILAVAANAAGALAPALYVPTLMTAVYNQAKRSPCTLRFHIATEGGWDSGAATGCLAAALLLQVGAPIALDVLLSLVGAAAIFMLLRRYYGASGTRSSVANTGQPA
jgi:DHA1 family inner membrane transport protein